MEVKLCSAGHLTAVGEEGVRVFAAVQQSADVQSTYSLFSFQLDTAQRVSPTVIGMAAAVQCTDSSVGVLAGVRECLPASVLTLEP